MDSPAGNPRTAIADAERAIERLAMGRVCQRAGRLPLSGA